MNALTPFARVPAELLSEIQYQYAQECWEAYELAPWDDGAQLPYRWLAVTHVCSRWRNAALADGRLWAWIVPLRPECVEAFVQRSAQRLLTVIIPRLYTFVASTVYRSPEERKSRNENIENAMSLVLPQLPRVERLDLNASLHTPIDNIADAPALKSLTLRGVNSLDVQMLTELAKLPLPSLTALHSWCDPTQLTPFIRRNLTALTLSGRLIHGGCPQLLSLLEKTPRLEQLRVDAVDCVISTDDYDENGPPEGANRVELNRLRSIHLIDVEGGVSSVMLLQILKMPLATVCLKVTAREAYGLGDEEIGSAARGLFHILNDLGGQDAPLKVSLGHYGSETVCFKMWPDHDGPLIYEPFNDWGPPRITYELQENSNAPTPIAVAFTLPSYIANPARMAVVHVGMPVPPTNEDWQALSKRIHYGKFVAEAKFRSHPELYIPLIEAGDAAGILKTLTDAAVENKVCHTGNTLQIL